MTTPATMQVPRSGLCFAAPVLLAAAESVSAPRRFAGVAYGGGVITDHGWWDAVGFDLAGVTAAVPMPLFLQHDQDRQIGVVDQVLNDGAQLSIAGKLFTGIDAAADLVAAKADAGAPWQLSVGIYPDQIDQVSAGHSYSLNGRAQTGPGHVFRRSRVREVSFVALGADGTTRANVFTGGDGPVDVPLSQFTTEGAAMADQDTAAALAAMTTERDAQTARADKAVADLAALQGQFDARNKAERTAAVQAMLGEQFGADAAAPYLDMTPVQFAAVSATFTALRSNLPAGFTAEQATAGAAATGSGLSPDAIKKYRADNPGSTYEQAFNALTGAGTFTAATHF